MVTARTRRFLVSAGWVLAVVATVLNGVVVGYGAIWFQLFGDTADAEDYRLSAGGYGAAALVLLLAVPAVLAHRAPRWLAWLAGSCASVLALMALDSYATATRLPAEPHEVSTVWDGVGGVLWAPWTWVLVALGVRATYRLARSRRTGLSRS